MNVKPSNRYLLIKKIEEEKKEKESAFLLPEDYKKKDVERYTLAEVLATAEDCKMSILMLKKKQRCIVETSMINEIKVMGETYHVVQENYVVLILEE